MMKEKKSVIGLSKYTMITGNDYYNEEVTQMPDREKVIKALQSCSVQNDVGCQQCPYFESRKAYGYEWCTTEMAQDALELLKEQDTVEHALETLRLAGWKNTSDCSDWVYGGVVRCKDCCFNASTPHNPFCSQFNVPTNNPDFYCAYGERKTDN